MIILETNIVTPDAENERLYDYAFIAFQKIIPSRKGIKKAIKNKCILVDGEVGASGWKLRAGQRLDLLSDHSKIPKVYELPLEVLYEDEQVAVIHKPAGIVVSGNFFRTVYNALGYNLNKSKQLDALPYPTPCHRLDKSTSGCLLIAKTKTAQINIGKQFVSKSIQKNYLAIVHGDLDEEGEITSDINNQIAQTKYSVPEKVISKSGEVYSVVKLSPLTGRTHQLRIHLSSIGHPILGDKLYGKEGNILLHKGLFLFAIAISFISNNDAIHVKTSTPLKFQRILKLFRR